MAESNMQFQRKVAFFTDHVIVEGKIQANHSKEKSGKVEKMGYLRIVLLDQTSSQALETVLTTLTAKNLVKLLEDGIQKVEKVMNAKGIPDELKQNQKSSPQSYVG